MKKRMLNLLLFTFMFLVPFTVRAEVINLDNYEQKNLIDTLKEENIIPEFENYEENDDQVTIYMFRGNGCGYCRGFLAYLNSITEEYGDLFKLRSFEVWSDSKNSELLQNMVNVTGQASTGIPYIMIGEKVFKGYIADWNDDILEAIKTEAAKKKKFDYFEQYNESQKETIDFVYVAIILSDVVVICAFYFISNKNKKDVMRHMTKIYRRLQSNDVDSNNEAVEEVEKEETKAEEYEEENDLDDKKPSKDMKKKVKKNK